MNPLRSLGYVRHLPVHLNILYTRRRKDNEPQWTDRTEAEDITAHGNTSDTASAVKEDQTVGQLRVYRKQREHLLARTCRGGKEPYCPSIGTYCLQNGI